MKTSFVCCLLVSCWSSLSWAESPLPVVPDGFEIEVVASSPLVEHPMMGGFDDRGRLYIAESAGMNLRSNDLLAEPPNFVRRLEDTDGDGKFDKSTIFADKMTLPMGALWYRGSLYVASPPNIWRLTDTDDDGVADVREIIAGTFGFSGNAASVHGCFLSPDGRIFWCDGRHGHEFVDENGDVVSQGKAARIFCCRPDGSDLRTFCGGGMDNPVEVDFTETGEVIGTANIMYGRPRVDTLVHWIENGVYPRADQGDCIAEFDHTGSLIPPITGLGHVAVSGTTRYRSEQFGEEYRDNFFITIFNTNRILRSVLTPSGSTWTSREEDFLVSDSPDFHPTDVIEDADGSLLVIDTGGWFRIGCPTSQIAKPELRGAIYRIRKTGAPKVDDPRGMKLDWKQLSREELAELLGDPRFAVREKAIDELALNFGNDRATACEFANEISVSQKSERLRRNYLWMLSRITPEKAIDSAAEFSFLRSRLNDPDESVRLAAIKLIGQTMNPTLKPLTRSNDEVAETHFQLMSRLSEFLTNGTSSEKRAATEAFQDILGRGNIVAVNDLILLTRKLLKVLAEPDVDRHLEHTCVHALLKVGHLPTLQAAMNHELPQVRRNALVVLSQRENATLTSAQVFPLLSYNDPLIQTEALRVIQSHPEWITETQKQLDDWLSAPEITEETAAQLRGFLIAMFDRKEIRESVRQGLEKPETSDAVRLFLLETLDLVSGMIFTDEWVATLKPGLTHENEQVVLQTLRLLRKDVHGRFDSELLAVFEQHRQSPEIALAALTALAPRLNPAPDSAVKFLLAEMQNADQTLSSLKAAETLVLLPELSQPQQDQLAKTLPQTPAHVLPVLQEFVRSSATEVQQAYLGSVIEHRSADRFSESDLADWSQRTSSAKVQSLLKQVQTARLAAIGERKNKLDGLIAHMTSGDPKKGEQVFFSRRAACASCHRIESQGGQVGPDLSQIGRIRTQRDLLEAIVFPSASFARGYEPFTVVTESGRTYNGVIESETANEIVLRTTDQRTIRLPHSEIELLKQSEVSVMPQGIDKLLSPAELQDLLAFLKSRQAGKEVAESQK